MSQYREVEERRVYGDGPVAARPPYYNPVAWVIGALIVIAIILALIFGLGHRGTTTGPVVRRPATSSGSSSGVSGHMSGSGSGSAGTTSGSGSGSASGSAGGGGTSGTTNGR
jgi:hypothetical protein